MSKQRYINVLRELSEHFENDAATLDLINSLLGKVDLLQLNPLVKVEERDLNSFPVPVELVRDASAFAIFADGACRGNPGPGAWGAMGQNAQGDVLFESSGIDVPTTNNRMELTGAIEAIQKIQEYMSAEGFRTSNAIHLFSDSKYLIDGINQWVEGWKKRGWKKADGKAPENMELWKRLDDLRSELTGIHFHWVKGHAGHPQNEQCDFLANNALDNSGF